MRILYVIPSYSIAWGGPSKVVYDLSKALTEKGIDIDILTTYKNDEALYQIPDNVKLIKFRQSKFSVLWTGFSSDMIGYIRNLNAYDLIHIHELWHFPHFAAYLLNKGLPYIVTIHGGLDEWCLGHKRMKKKIYSALIQKRILRKANMIHVLTSEEKESVSKYLGRPLSNIVTIPNGLDLKEFENLPDKGSFRRKYPILKNKRYILFLGRINTKKGLDILVDAFKELQVEYDDLYLVVAGPDNEGYAEKIKVQLKGADLLEKTIFTGMLKGRDKIEAFVDAVVFVLCSYSEGFPIAAIEAMACKIPIVISDKVGIHHDVSNNEAGVVVETKPESLYTGIRKLLQDERLRERIAEKGRTMVEEFYNTEKVADMMKAAYMNILEKKD